MSDKDYIGARRAENQPITLTDAPAPAENFFAPDAPDGTPDPGPTSEGEKPEEKQPLRLIIEVLPNGALNVAGPINDIVLTFGLLEMAKVSVLEHRRNLVMQQEQAQREDAKIRQQIMQKGNQANMRDFIRRK